jgi:hypothetical protein
MLISTLERRFSKKDAGLDGDERRLRDEIGRP